MYWIGDPPNLCQVCFSALGKVFYDAALPLHGGVWGNICEICFEQEECSLGIGRGQKYEQQEDGRFLCVAGGKNDEGSKGRNDNAAS